MPAADFEPRADTLDIWFIDVARATSAADWALLTDDEAAKAKRIIIPDKCTQSARARAELRRILAAYLDADPAALRFAYSDHGKPSLAAEAHGERVTFNLSHSGAVALVGVVVEGGPLRLGVDVEQVLARRSHDEIAESFFAADELRDYMARGASERVAEFYRYWACKEAYLKALGTGLSFSSQGFSIRLDPRGGATLRSSTYPGDAIASWQIRELPCKPDYAAAVCWDTRDLELRLFVGPTSAGDWPT